MYIPVVFSPLFIILGLYAISRGGNFNILIGMTSIIMGLIIFGMVAYFFINDKKVKSKQG